MKRITKIKPTIKDDIPDFILKRFGLNRITEDVNMVKNNQSTPGMPDMMRRITGLNTDENGSVDYTSANNHRSHKIRNEKIHVVRRALREPEVFGDKTGDILVVAWGSGRGVLKESIEKLRSEGISVSGVHLKMVYPLPLMLAALFKSFKKVITIEMAYGDALKPTPLATLLSSETLLDIQCGISDATGRPLKPTQVISKIQELVKG